MQEEDYLTQEQLDCLRFLEDRENAVLLHKASSFHQTKLQPQDESFDLLFDLHPQAQMQRAKLHLDSIRSQIDNLSSLSSKLTSFEHDFSELSNSKHRLEASISMIQGDSGHILERQNKMVALSLEMQEILDHYHYIQKFSFESVIEGENDAAGLQLKLSQLTEGMEFFASHPGFAGAGKHLQRYENEKRKMLGLVRGFLLKIFNKEDYFVMKQCKTIHLQSYFSNCYPKATYKFLSEYILLFPQFKPQLTDLLRDSKETEENISQLTTKKEEDIEEFLLSSSTRSLIKYIEFNQPELYSKTLIDMFSFSRPNIHKALASQFQHNREPLQNILCLLNYLIYLVPSELVYLSFCLNLEKPSNIQLSKSIVLGMVNTYSHLLKPLILKLKGWRQVATVVQSVTQLKATTAETIDNYIYKMQYKIYPLGRVMTLGNPSTQSVMEIIDTVFEDLFAVLEKSLQFYLPKDFHVAKIVCPEPSIQEMIDILPNLKHCSKLGSGYVVQALDGVLRAINNASMKLETRYEAFLWNLTSVYGIQVALSLANITKPLLKTEMTLNLGGTVSMLNSVGKIENKGSIWNYAKEVFNALSTGLPILNQLTIDFNDHLKTYMEKLQLQFVKDLTFIYGKSMIEFLQKAHTSQEEEEVNNLMSPDNLKSEYQRLVLGMEEFVSESVRQFQVYKRGYTIEGQQYGPKLITSLMEQVLENLLELLSDFYIASSKYVDVQTVGELEFKDIKEVKEGIVKKLKGEA